MYHKKCYAIYAITLLSRNLKVSGFPASGAAEHIDTCNSQRLTQANFDPEFEKLTGDNGTVETDPYHFFDQWPLHAGHHVARAIGDPRWNLNVQKGKKLWDGLQLRLGDPNAQDYEVRCGIESRWRHFGEILPPSFLRRAWDHILGQHDVMPEYDSTEMVWIPQFLSAPVESPEPRVKFAYSSLYSTMYKAIVASFSQGFDISINGDMTRAPDRWSEITWSYWKALNEVKGTDPSDLRYVLREQVTNSDTQYAINDILGLHDQSPLPPILPMDFAVGPDDEGFYALLGCPNVIGVLYMLAQFPNGLNRKTIKSIHMTKIDPSPGFLDPEYFLVIELESYATNSPQVISSQTTTRGTIDTE